MAGQTDTIKDTSRIILFSVGIIVLTAMVFFAYRYFNEKRINDDNQAKIESLNNEILALEEKILNFEVTIEDQNMKLAEKTRELGEKDAQIEDLLNQLNNARSQNTNYEGKIRQLEERLKQMQRFVNQYKEQIATLEEQNQQLETQVADLTASEEQLEESFTELQSYNQETEQKLEETIKVASVLQTSDYKIYNIKKNDKVQSLKESYRRGAVHKFNVCFNIRENLVAEPGSRQIFLVVENPDGSINTNYEDGLSGNFMYEGIEKEYSSFTTFDYSRLMQEVCVSYIPTSNEKKIQKGTYYVNVYCEGNLIGQSSVEVK